MIVWGFIPSKNMREIHQVHLTKGSFARANFSLFMLNNIKFALDYVANEVAMDYNAGFQGILAGLKKKACP